MLGTVGVLWLYLMVLWVGLQCVSVVFPGHYHLLFGCIVLCHSLHKSFEFSYTVKPV